jgi:transcriptional regulator with XRE-family HTH domain
MTRPKQAIGINLNKLIQTKRITQTEIARQLNVPPSQVNRFIRGHNDIYAQHLIEILGILGIDLEQIIHQRIQYLNGTHVNEIRSINECILYLMSELDPLGQQTYLNSLLWAAQTYRQEEISKHVVDIVNKQSLLV